ncbi:unnamed protein product [Microthlaspi erraticum]|uniref:Retrotransposon gag domain-containing protein n=1 Tax=Microthlaspi erraticum TaxID=1685480 RepID=A0A6D2JNF3_9BRAS|nr:unnamed protein product [Microthlaspi erraticum]
MNPGGEGAPNRPHNPPDQERRANDPPNPAEARADQPAPARDVPPPNPNAPDAAEPLQPPLNPPRPPPAFANGHHRHGDNQGMPQDQPHAPPRRVPNAQHPRHQTMGDFDSSDAFFMDRNPIRPPLPPRNDFEIKPQIIALVKQNQFHGLPTEHPLDHVDTFEEICSTTRVNGVSPDYFKCKLFTFSLSDKALRWVKSLPPQSITTWNEYKGAFLNQFYTKQRSNSIRSKISGFKQDSMESFYEALERFKEYTRSCPNHGFSEGNLWNIFYNGIDHKYKLSLDTASNGNFMTKSVPEAKLLIENLAASDANACPDYNRSVKTTSSSESAQISELRNMVSQLLKSRQGVHAIEDALATNEDTLMDFMRDGAEENLEEVNYIGGNYGNRGFNPPFRAHPNLSYRSNNVENPNDQVYPNQGAYQGGQYQSKPQQVYPRGMYQVKQPFTFSQETNPTQTGEKVDVALKKYMEEQRLITKNLYEKLDHMFGDLSSKFGSLSTHVQKLEVQIAQTAEAAKKQNEVNTQKFCSVVSSIDGTIVPTLSQGEEEENEPKERHKPERYSWESRRAYKRRLEGKPLQKQEDPGKFVITSSINGIQLHDCLCDTGANVNLMSLALAKDLGFKEFKSPKIRVEYRAWNLIDVDRWSGPKLLWESSIFWPHPARYLFPKCKFQVSAKCDQATTRRSHSHYLRKKDMLHGERRERNQLHLLPTFDEYGAEEETNGAPNLFHKIRIFTPKDSELKGDQSIEEKLERTMKLFPKALVFKDDVRDDHGATTPPQEATEPENGEAKGILCPSATLHHD